MEPHVLRGARHEGAFRGVAIALVLTPLSGCTTTRPDPRTEHSIAQATGLAEAITFRVEGGPLDEADTGSDSLSIAEATRRAVTTDPGIQAALARVRIAMAEADQARLLPNPVLSVV